MTREKEFELVAAVRSSIANVGKEASEATKAEYNRIYQRMIAKNEEPADAKSRCDFYRRRAALIFVTAGHARDALRQRDRSAYQSPEWEAAMAEIGRIGAILERYAPDPLRRHHAEGVQGICWTDVRNRLADQGIKPLHQSKRGGVSALTRRRGWRDELFAVASDGYRDALAVSLCTGARPAEIAKGVEIRRHAEGLQLTIKGAKVGATRGQPTRVLLVRIDSAAARHLAGLADAGPAVVATNAKRFSDATAAAGRRAFPSLRARITPYTLRHVAASALKASGVDSVALAEALGHRATRSQQAYGRACHGRREATGIIGVAASAPVRQTRRDPATALRRMPGTPRLG